MQKKYMAGYNEGKQTRYHNAFGLTGLITDCVTAMRNRKSITPTVEDTTMKSDFKVLIVDDDAMNIDILRDDLEEKYTVASSESGEDALELIPTFRPDVILLDIMMTGIDGYEVCRRIRADHLFDETKIILISGRAMDNERQKGFEVGADDYITKPFDVENVDAKIQALQALKARSA